MSPRSSEDFRFAELPAPRLDFADRAARIDDYFSGQHEKNLFKGSSEQKAVSVGGEEHFVRSKNFTELDRLSLLVHQVEHDCQVVPLGAYKMIPTHELAPNPNFRGLKIEQSKSLDSFVHLRAPELPEKKLLVGTATDRQRATRPSSGRTSSTPPARTRSGRAGRCRPTSPRPRSPCAAWSGRATWATTAPTPASSAASTWATASRRRISRS